MENDYNIQIEANTSNAEQSTKRLEDALDKLLSVLDELKNSLDKNTESFKQFSEAQENSNKSAEKSNKSLGNNIKTFVTYGTYLGIMVKGLLKATEQARDFETTMNYFNVVFGTANKEMQEFVQNMSDAFGIDPKDVMNVASNFGAFATTIGLTSQKTNILSRNLTQLAYDISALRGGDVSSWAAKLQSAVAGQGKALKEAGLGYTNATLQSYALSKGYDITVSSLDAASKAQLTYNYLIENSGLYQGQFAQRIGTTNNQLYIFQQQVQMAARAIGSVFIPIINAVLPYIIAFFRAIQSIFGLSDINWGDNVVQPINNVGGSLDKANKSAEKLKKNLLGIDELNIVSDSSSAGASSALGGLGSFNPELKEYDNLMKSITDKTDELSEKIEPYVKALKDGYDWLVKHKELVITIIAILAGLVILSKVFGLFGGATQKASKFLDRLGTAAIIIATLGGLALVLREISNLIDKVSKSGLEVNDIIKLIAISVGVLALSVMGILLMAKSMNIASVLAIVAVLGGLALVLHTLTDMIDTFSKTGTDFIKVVAGLGLMLGILGLFMAGIAVIGPLMAAGLIPFIAIMTTLALTLPPITKAIGDLFVAISSGLSDVIEALGTALPPIIDSIGRLIEKLGNIIIKILREAGKLVDKVLTSIIKFIDKLGPKINKFVSNVISAVTKLINFIVSGIEFLVNSVVIDGVNTIIRAINKIGDKVGFTIGLVPDFQMRRFTPKLAKGGMTTRATEATIGEAGREAILPLTNKSVMREIASAITQSGGTGNGGTDERDYTFNITTKLDGQVVYRNQEKIRRQKGATLTKGAFAT